MTDTKDTAAQIAELWNLSDEGKAEWWADCIRPNPRHHLDEHDTDWLFSHDGRGASHIEDQHALDILKGHAEDWLRGRLKGVISIGVPNNQMFYNWLAAVYNHSLPAAIRAEMERSK